MNYLLRKTMPLLCFGSVLFGCVGEESDVAFCNRNLDKAIEQTETLLQLSLSEKRIPRSLYDGDEIHWARENFDWTEGFFPGTNWFFYEYSNNDVWKNGAEALQKMFVDHRFYTHNHDLGFVFNSSFGHQYRLTNDSHAKAVLIDAGNSLITRFNPAVGCIQSWDVDKGWQAKRDWQFPVIIDNMMNLELLFELTKTTGDKRYADIAKIHANTTMKNHFRPDGSSYHVIDYDSISGDVRKKETAQGFAHESVWARGQSWGVYGYTVCYRYTKNPIYLAKARSIADYIISQPNMPADHIPYWDFSAPMIPNEPRDASAAAVTASALIELSEYTDGAYLDEARFILKNLSSDDYLASSSENGNYILKHSVGSIPHNSEIDKPLSYADYYYVEALMRLRNYNN